MKILVTGKSGVGKTFLLNSYKHYSVDEYTKKVWIKKGQKYYDFVKDNFGNEFVNDEQIETKKLGRYLFSNPDKLEKVNLFVVPIVFSWINSLPHNSIIEFAQYINNEKLYIDLFDKIILVENSNPKLDNKFPYMKKQFQPILNKKIKYDYLIDNSNFNGEEQFNNCVEEILKNS